MMKDPKQIKSSGVKKLFNQFRIVVINEETFEEKFIFKLSPITIILGTIISIIFISSITYLTIAYSPIREFIPGYTSTKMINPDFVAIDKGYFIDAKKVEKREKLNDEIKKMIQHKGPYLLEVIIEKEDNVFPMIASGSSVSDVRLE